MLRSFKTGKACGGGGWIIAANSFGVCVVGHGRSRCCLGRGSRRRAPVTILTTGSRRLGLVQASDDGGENAPALVGSCGKVIALHLRIKRRPAANIKAELVHQQFIESPGG